MHSETCSWSLEVGTIVIPLSQTEKPRYCEVKYLTRVKSRKTFSITPSPAPPTPGGAKTLQMWIHLPAPTSSSSCHLVPGQPLPPSPPFLCKPDKTNPSPTEAILRTLWRHRGYQCTPGCEINTGCACATSPLASVALWNTRECPHSTWVQETLGNIKPHMLFFSFFFFNLEQRLGKSASNWDTN